MSATFQRVAFVFAAREVKFFLTPWPVLIYPPQSDIIGVMKYTILFLSLALANCATSPRDKWRDVYPNQPKADLIKAMGNPDEFSKEDGKEVLTWKIDNFESCSARLSKTGAVERKSCIDDPKARSEANQRAMEAYLQMRQNRARNNNANQPIEAYQMPINKQMNCTSRTISGITKTECNY